MRLKDIVDRIGYFPIAFFSFSLVCIFYFFNHREYLDPSEYYDLSRQLTPDKKYYIYKYARYGAAFTGDISGTRLIERDKKFAENEGSDFPGGLVAWPSKDTALIHNRWKSSRGYESIDDIIVKYDTCQCYEGQNSGPYRFDSLAVSNDTIQILGIQDSDVSTLICPLGPTIVFPHAGMISTLKVTVKHKYHNAENQPRIVWTTYELIPTVSIPVSSLGETGYFISLK